ncbi:iron-sulfur cluster assembly protein NAR1 SCDLUD_003046 [Saccharomycodes ludwigii]|uniref:iron-sulfur cluster assembly protein NAR1 n=1 Tax=Saccharomycodes ludwigii TaxID=36035 RepID=UPI001E866E93|nr:hypothetical protein SCDLUD_003046 [Saccharomycodes ludwigii]KAH3901549.1 hypothetical protein SCDLUD_003046 [Saccharomycodes ludwigii]
MSAILSEEDLNDFISPGTACIKPIKNKQTQIEKTKDNELEVGKEDVDLEKVSISLQDCLACSGCITSSEELLLSKQSAKVFLDSWMNENSIKNQDRILAVSISPQCRISLSKYFNDITVSEFDKIFLTIMHEKFGATYIVGTQIGREIAIEQMIDKLDKCATPTGALPKLSSVCPGFVLYCEKTNPTLLPHLLNVKSPQQITGSVLKNGLRSNKIYHLSIMPCFDKKLEASREDGENEVDCVITPKEVVNMFADLNIDFNAYPVVLDKDAEVFYKKFNPSMLKVFSDPVRSWCSNEGSSSGGYAYQYILHEFKKYTENNTSDELYSIETVHGKNNDIKEYRLMKNGEIVKCSCELYGFRNIQNMVRKFTLKSPANKINKKLVKLNTRLNRLKGTTTNTATSGVKVDPFKSDFIEVMACPSGCINGGGLIFPEQTDNNAKRRTLYIKELNKRYEEQLKNLPLIVKDDINKHDKHAYYEYTFKSVKDSKDVGDISSDNNNLNANPLDVASKW